MGCPTPDRKYRNLVINPTKIDGNSKSDKLAKILYKIQSIGLVVDTNYATTEKLTFLIWSPYFPDVPPSTSIGFYETIFDETSNTVGMRLNQTDPYEWFGPLYLLPYLGNNQTPIPTNQPNSKNTNQSKYPMSKGFVADQAIIKPDKKWVR